MGVHPRRTLAACGFLLAAAVAVPVLLGQFSATAREQIVGGSRASIADHPYVVHLTTSNGFQFCGGTLVAPNKVMTAAHCATAFRPREVRVVAGREDKQSTAQGVVRRLSNVWVHPAYVDAVEGADIAILTLSEPVAYRPIPVAGESRPDLYKAGSPGTILGWGRTSDGGPLSRYLLKATVPLISDESCEKSYRGYLAESMVCAGLPQGGIDACQGDSGGPLIVAGILVGIASWGEGCALPDKPGVYTRVAAYIDEITKQLDV